MVQKVFRAFVAEHVDPENSAFPVREINSKFLAAQTAGSLRIEGIPVSAEDEIMMQGIIDGTVDADSKINEILAKHGIDQH